MTKTIQTALSDFPQFRELIEQHEKIISAYHIYRNILLWKRVKES
jgi:hypothetical protein